MNNTSILPNLDSIIEFVQAESHHSPPSRQYRSPFLDNSLWNTIELRPSDVIITSVLRSGTTWTQSIVLWLVRGKQAATLTNAPYADLRRMPKELEAFRTHFEMQTERRVLKSHMPLDGILFDPAVKYIYVTRSGLDVFMSLFAHYQSFNSECYAKFPDLPPFEMKYGKHIFPNRDDAIRAYFDDWVSSSCFDSETNGYPFWSFTHGNQSWFNVRGYENILFVHYNHLKQDLKGQIERIARFLEIDVSDEQVADISCKCTFASMKKDAVSAVGDWSFMVKGGSGEFLFKGTNDRWKGILRSDQIEKYFALLERECSQECIDWIENARMAE